MAQSVGPEKAERAFLRDNLSMNTETSSMISTIIPFLEIQHDKNMQLIKTMIASFNHSLISILEETSSSQSNQLNAGTFDGQNQDPAIWMNWYEVVCRNNHWNSDNQKVLNLVSNFPSGSMPHKWFYSFLAEENPNNWVKWKASFLRSFGQNLVESAKSANDYQYQGGSLMEYFYEKQERILRAYGKLSDRALNLMIMLGLPDSMQESMSLLELDSKEQMVNALSRTLPLKQIQQQQANLKDKFNSLNVKYKNNNETSNCHTDHFDVMSSHTQSEIKFSPLTQKLVIYGQEVLVLLDTGASVNLINSDLVKENGWLCRNEDTILRGFNGSTELLREVVDIKILSHGIEVNAVACVMENLAYRAIIGLPTLRKLGYTLVQQVNTTLKSSVQMYSKEDVIKTFPNICEFRGRPDIQIEFHLNKNSPIIKQKPYRLSREKYIWSQNKVQDLLNQHIIRPSESAYASPCVIVPKENGTWRLCQDYREVNKFTELDPFPFPIIDDIICNFGGCNFFSKLDLKDGFLQLPLSENTKKFSAFVLPFGHFEFNVLPFGWKNSPPKFQRYMTQVLGDLLKDPLINVYIDDIIIGGHSRAECANKTYLVLKKIMDKKLRLNLEKSTIVQPKISFLGRIIDGNTKTTKEESINKVRNMRRPHDLHSLRVFTGLTGHFRAFIPNYAQIARPLDQLKAKGVKFVWTPQAEEAFQTLVCKITENPILQLPDWNLTFELCTDASHYGCGAILYQRDVTQKKNHQLRVIGYYSHTFSKTEINYSVTDKEGLSVINAIKYFRTYLEGRRFVVHTDHQALTHIMTQKEPKGRLGRWQVFLMGYNVEINHRHGKELEDADAISRLCVGDQEVERVVNTLTNGRIRVSKEDIPKILKLYHDDPSSGGHDGFLRTYKKLKQRFTWPKMKGNILSYIKSCHDCQLRKFKFKPKPDVMVIPRMSKTPFETLHLDFAEESKKSEANKSTKSFLVIVDECSRFCMAKALKESSKAIINYLKSNPHINKVKRIVTDNGPQFTSKAFKDFAAQRGISLTTCSPYHPAGNGLAERKIRDIKLFFALYPNFRGGWKACLEAAVNHLNRSYSAGIGCSPYFKAYGVPPLLPADKEYGITTDTIKEKDLTVEEQEAYRNRIKKYFDKRHAKKIHPIFPGNYILVQSGFSNKTPVVNGPFLVKRVINMNSIPKAVIYEDFSGQEKTAALKNILLYHCRSNVDSESGRV